MPAAVAVTKSYYKYLADNGVTYRVRLADYIAAQLDGAGNSIIGAVPADGTEPKLGGGHYLRRAVVRDLAGKVDRTVIIPDADAPMIELPPAAGATTLTLNRGVNSHTYTYQGNYLTETRGRRA